MAELVFFTGTMDCGKSTLALQTDHNHRQRGRRGLVLTSRDRAGEGVLSSRLGLERPAVEVSDGLDLWQHVVDLMSAGGWLDYLIADEAQFYTQTHVEQLARLVDELQLDVYAFGISTDFDPGDSGTVGYEVLCRRHHLARMSARTAHAATLSPDPLPFGDPTAPG